MNIERGGKISVTRKYTRAEMVERFYNTKEALQALDARITEDTQAIEALKKEIENLEESKSSLVWFLQESGAMLDKTKKK